MGPEARLHHQNWIRCVDPLVSMPIAEGPKLMHVLRLLVDAFHRMAAKRLSTQHLAVIEEAKAGQGQKGSYR